MATPVSDFDPALPLRLARDECGRTSIKALSRGRKRVSNTHWWNAGWLLLQLHRRVPERDRNAMCMSKGAGVGGGGPPRGTGIECYCLGLGVYSTGMAMPAMHGEYCGYPFSSSLAEYAADGGRR